MLRLSDAHKPDARLRQEGMPFALFGLVLFAGLSMVVWISVFLWAAVSRLLSLFAP
jgi:hypothetical protein